MWHELILLNRPEENSASANCRLPRESLWFDGHFPDNPVLPGMAQLAMAFELIQKAMSDQPLKVIEVRRVRFKQIIGPDDPVTLKISLRSGTRDLYDFQILKEKELACSGTMAVEPASNIDLKLNNAEGER